MTNYIDKKALLNAIQRDYEKRMEEMYKEEIYKGFYSKVYCDGVDDEYKSILTIIARMDGDDNG